MSRPLLHQQKMIEVVRQAAVETGIFPLGDLRVRAYLARDYAIGDGDPSLAFVALSLALAQGRPAATRAEAGAYIFKALEAAMAPAFAAGPLALSFEVREVEADSSFKSNTVHAALAARSKP